MKYRVFILFYFVLNLGVLAQVPSANFAALPPACLQEQLQFENLSVNASQYEWDFCEGDLKTNPSFVNLGSVSGASGLLDLRVVYDGASYFAFGCSVDNNRIIRFNFGSDIKNTPIISNVTSPLILPTGVEIFNKNGLWYGVVGNFLDPAQIALLTFGTSLSNTPSTTILPTTITLRQIRAIRHTVENGSIVLFVANSTNNSVARLILNQTMDGSILSEQLILVTGASNVFGLYPLKIGNAHYLMVTDISSGNIFKIDFGNAWTNVVSGISPQTLTSPLTNPTNIELQEEDDAVIGIMTTSAGEIVRLEYPADFQSDTPTQISLGSFGGISGVRGLGLLRANGHYYGFYTSFSFNNLSRLSFEKNCSFVTSEISVAEEPRNISYQMSGAYIITLRAYNSQGEKSFKSQSLTVNSITAPSLQIEYSGICISAPVAFQTSSISGASYMWDFGDNVSSTDQSPSHTYGGVGEYEVQLVVTDGMGCSNIEYQSIGLFDEPLPDFALPTGLICTNNEFTFSNNTVDNFDGNLTYQWLIDAVPISNDIDLVHTFDSGGDKEIKLQASIPGCTSETTQVLSNVGDGPVVDFSIDGNCLNESIQFTNNSAGDIDSYAWDFGNGEVSNETSPSLLYTGAGMFDVELQTLGSNGCTSTKVIPHQIYSIPQPSFNIDLPPFSCNGSPTQFNDLTPPLTDSNLDTWQWNFGDGAAGSNAPSPQHTYDLSGVYSVMLTVVSDQGCSTQVTQDITISEAPTPVITNSPACVNMGVELSETSGVVASAWQWQIGNAFYFTENPSHVFGQPGDYSINLMLTSENGCIGTTLKEINVPDPLSVDFESTKKCVGTESQFTALSSGSLDLPSTYLWQFGSEERSGAISNYAFATEGLQEVQLTITTTSGCSYSINKAITILPAPQADFSFTPAGGAPPLAVQFTNLSTHTSAYRWSFNDTGNTTSTATAPSFVFTEIGNYPVDLLASNEEGCESTRTRLVSVALPFLNVSLENVGLLENPDGSIRILSALHNNGNLTVQNLALEIELSNGTRLRETLQESLSGGEQIIYQLSTIIGSATDLQFLCLKIVLANNASEAIQERCVALQTATALTPPYPNPATDLLVLEWVSATEETVSVRVINLSGKEVLAESFSAQQGLNTKLLNTQDWQSGLYLVKFKSPTADRTFRTIIAR